MLSILLSAAVLGYFVYVGKQRISDIESYTKNYSIALVNTFAGAAEMGYKRGPGDRLRALFGEIRQKNTFDEAFFVLRDGTLVVHSIEDTAKEIRGNISNDEISYNRDLILKPLLKNSREIQFTDYNIVSKRIPFNRMERTILKNYLYGGIDTSGWLVSKSVFQKKEPVGTMNLIIGKDRIFEFIEAQREESVRMFFISLAFAFAISFILAMVIFIRYRTIQRDTLAQAEEKLGYRIEEVRAAAPVFNEETAMAEPEKALVSSPVLDEVPSIVPPAREETIAMELFEDVNGKDEKGPGRIIDLYSAKRERETSAARVFPRAEAAPPGRSHEIKEAIPIPRRRSV